ncbi:DUF4156 domain-containing protein [Kangiella geojedonensis]|uniref:Membrane protein n=1 Tax=Kangiella geojedonensis TaxID=914150 RepID=A0A0F6TRL4_9GAMM|nr:DUF4156 domain-containing protein [Kangiella geojedonensis]AKE52779.1 membrane protein [Kangiella geojedonensis]
MKKLVLIIFWGISLAACSAIQTKPGAENIELVNEVPSKTKCTYLGEIAGSQGNWATGDFTSNENLVVGARNDLRNKAFDLGGNLVYIQDHKNTNAWGSLGTTNTTVIGKVYRCNFQ